MWRLLPTIPSFKELMLARTSVAASRDMLYYIVKLEWNSLVGVGEWGILSCFKGEGGGSCVLEEEDRQVHLIS